MVYRTPYPWYIKPPTYGILFDLPYPWYIDPPTHGMSNHLPMVFCFTPQTHGISNPLPMVYQTTCLWYFVTKSYKNVPFAKTKTALKVQIFESPASGLLYVTTVIVTY